MDKITKTNFTTVEALSEMFDKLDEIIDAVNDIQAAIGKLERDIKSQESEER